MMQILDLPLHPVLTVADKGLLVGIPHLVSVLAVAGWGVHPVLDLTRFFNESSIMT